MLRNTALGENTTQYRSAMLYVSAPSEIRAREPSDQTVRRYIQSVPVCRLLSLTVNVKDVLHFLSAVANTVIVRPLDGYVINFSISLEVVHLCSRT